MYELSDKTGKLIIGGFNEKECRKLLDETFILYLDPIKLNKFLAIIVKSREIQRNIVQGFSLEQAGFCDYAEKLGAPIVDAEHKNTNMITNKVYENHTNRRRRLKRPIFKQRIKFTSKQPSSLKSINLIESTYK